MKLQIYSVQLYQKKICSGTGVFLLILQISQKSCFNEKLGLTSIMVFFFAKLVNGFQSLSFSQEAPAQMFDWIPITPLQNFSVRLLMYDHSCCLQLNHGISFCSRVHFMKNDLTHIFQPSTLLKQELDQYFNHLYFIIEVKLEINKSKKSMFDSQYLKKIG